MCVISTYRNFKSLQHNQKYFKSLEMQNFSSFKVVMIDDASTDDSIKYIKEKITNYPRVNNRLFLVHNS